MQLNYTQHQEDRTVFVAEVEDIPPTLQNALNLDVGFSTRISVDDNTGELAIAVDDGLRQFTALFPLLFTALCHIGTDVRSSITIIAMTEIALKKAGFVRTSIPMTSVKITSTSADWAIHIVDAVCTDWIQLQELIDHAGCARPEAVIHSTMWIEITMADTAVFNYEIRYRWDDGDTIANRVRTTHLHPELAFASGSLRHGEHFGDSEMKRVNDILRVYDFGLSDKTDGNES